MADLTKLEMETIVTLNREEEFAEISTSDPLLKARMARAGFTPCRIDGQEHWWRVPRGSLRLKFPGEPGVRLAGGSVPRRKGSEIAKCSSPKGLAARPGVQRRVDASGGEIVK